MSSLIVMRNPTTGGVGIQTQEQFDVLYASRGWELATIDLDFASSVVGVKINDLAELDPQQVHEVLAKYNEVAPEDRKAKLLEQTADQLRGLAEAAGLAVSGSKTELADRIIEHEQTLSEDPAS